MNALAIKGSWNIFKGKMKQKWAKLADDDLQFIEGKEKELIGRIQKRTGESREQIEEEPVNNTCTCCGSHHEHKKE